MIDGIRDLLGNLAPSVEEALLPGASAEQIRELEAAVGRPLPDDLVRLYRATAGIDPRSTANFAFGLVFTDLGSLLEGLPRLLQEGDGDPLSFADPGIATGYNFGRLRLEIGHDNGRSKILVDLAPTAGGEVGQVIFVDSEYGVALKLADSVSRYLKRFEDDLSMGRYSLQEDALEDGVEWLEPVRDIDVGNWYNSPAWLHVAQAMKN